MIYKINDYTTLETAPDGSVGITQQQRTLNKDTGEYEPTTARIAFKGHELMNMLEEVSEVVAEFEAKAKADAPHGSNDGK